MTIGSRNVVGIRFPQWSSVGPATIGGVVDFMRRHELWQLVTENDSYGEMEAVKLEENWHGDGLILFRATEKELATFRRRGTAVVLTSTEGPDLGFPRVVPDNHEIGRIAARHLVECSLSQFAFLGRGETFYREEQFAPGMRIYARERLKGFRAELGVYSLEPQVHYLKGRPLWVAHTWREIQTEVMAFLQTLPAPCGLFVADDALGAVVMRAADALGIKVPDELAVIGYGDDHIYCYSTYPALSSIAHPAAEIGRLAAELLRRQMTGDASVTGSHIVPVSRVVARESSQIIAIPDPEIRELVGWIRRAAPHDPMRVTELADRSGLSLTTLKERFSKTLGVSPKQEITRVRLQHLKHLLRSTSDPLMEIARQMGFGSAHELGRFFRSETGVTPGAFRIDQHAGGRHQPSPRAVIFDMDGTLFDSESLYFEAFREAYAEQGGELTRDRYFRDHAGTTNESIEANLRAGAPAGFDAMAFSRRWQQIWDELLASRVLTPLPGVVGLLERLRSLEITVALASSSARVEIDRCLEISGLGQFFSHRTGGDEVSASKPDPAIFLLAAQRLGIEPAACLVIEDSSAGVAAAKAAEMKVVQVTGNGSGGTNACQKTIHSLAESDWQEIDAWFRSGC